MIGSSDAQGNFTVRDKLTGCDTGRRNWAAYGSPSIQCKNHSATCCCRKKIKMYTSHQWIDVNNSSADDELRPDFPLEASVIKESVIRAFLQRVFTRLCTVLRVLSSMATLEAIGCGSDVKNNPPEAPSEWEIRSSSDKETPAPFIKTPAPTSLLFFDRCKGPIHRLCGLIQYWSRFSVSSIMIGPPEGGKRPKRGM